MSIIRSSAQPAPRPRRLALWLGGGLLLPLVLILAVLGALSSFDTIQQVARPRLADRAWVAPIGIDIGILALLTADLLLSYLGWAWPFLRLVAWLFIASTVYLNIAESWGDWPGVVIHAALPTLFIMAIEGIRYFLRRYVGIRDGERSEGLPLLRWVADPIGSLLLRRRMALWNVCSFEQGLQMELERLETLASLKQRYGRWRWRWRAPLSDRLAMVMIPARRHAPAPSRPPRPGPPPARPQPVPTPSGSPTFDLGLVRAAQEIVQDARRKGITLNQTALGETLRQRGHSIANRRLPQLALAVGLHPSTPVNGVRPDPPGTP